MPTPDAILYWNEVLLEVHRRDFSFDDTAGDDESDAPMDRQSLSPEQGGPTKTSRVFAMVHLAMCDALNAVTPISIGGQAVDSYLGIPASPGSAGKAAAAVGGAASSVILGLYKFDTPFVTKQLDAWTASLSANGVTGSDIATGLQLGAEIGSAMLAARKMDGSDAPDTYLPLNVPGMHRPDPYGPNQGYLGPQWGKVKPFGETMPSSSVVDEPPLGAVALGGYLNAASWPGEFQKARDLGGAPATPTLTRTAEQSIIGIFWGYDGARNLGVPPRLYNQCLRSITARAGLNEMENAVLFALANVAMADGGIATWRTKYKYHVARPVIGIRESAQGFGTAAGASLPTFSALAVLKGKQTYQQVATWLLTPPTNPSMVDGDVTWAPLGAPQTNPPANVRNVYSRTPGFPAYPSGHATFGAACFGMACEVLKLAKPNLDVDRFVFEFVSDELNGSNLDADLSVRTRHVRSLTLAQAIHENAVSRVYLGVHWPMDAVEGVRTGIEVIDLIKKARRGPAKIFGQASASKAKPKSG
jgi:membrane-associated phospholipid phosphatase